MLKKSFLQHFASITDPRQEGKVGHHLMSIFFIAVAAYIANCEKWDTVVFWAKRNIKWLKKYIDLPCGIPSESTFYRVFRLVDPKEFERCFIGWTIDITARHNSRSVAIDGKTLCGAKAGSGESSLFHIVSAWASDSGLTLGFLKTNEKSNEITTIPELLKLLSVEGDVISADAMGTQTKIAKQIVKKNNADYVLALKSNHPSMYNDSVLFFTGVDNECKKEAAASSNNADKSRDITSTEVSMNVKSSASLIIQCFTSKNPNAKMLESFRGLKTSPAFFEYDYQFKKTSDSGHGRIEHRYYFLVPDVSWLSRHGEWEGLRSVGMVISSVTNKKTGAKSVDCRFYLTSLDNVEKFASSARKHWGIELSHYTLDVTFSEDQCLIHTEYGPENVAIIRRVARNILKVEIDDYKDKNPNKKLSYDTLRYKTSLDIDYLEKVMIGNLL
jgi:predicted transposase YbfD/YdcC